MQKIKYKNLKKEEKYATGEIRTHDRIPRLDLKSINVS